MEKTLFFSFFTLLMLLSGCSSNTSALEQAPPHIKETWAYFEDMSKTTDALDNGDHVDVAFDKYFSKQSEISTHIESTSLKTEEEELIYSYLYLMHLELSNLGIASLNESMGGEIVDVEQYVYDLQVPRYELEKIYKKYGLEYKN